MSDYKYGTNKAKILTSSKDKEADSASNIMKNAFNNIQTKKKKSPTSGH